MGIIDRATKERMKRIVGRDGDGTGLWAVKSGGGPEEEAMMERLKKAGEYDAWEKRIAKVIPGEDLGLKAVIKENTTRVVPKVRFLVSTLGSYQPI